MTAGQGLKPALDDKAPRCEADGCEVRPRMRFVGLGRFRCPWCGWVAEPEKEVAKYEDASFVYSVGDPDACDKCCFEFESDDGCCDAADDGNRCADGKAGWFVIDDKKAGRL